MQHSKSVNVSPRASDQYLSGHDAYIELATVDLRRSLLTATPWGAERNRATTAASLPHLAMQCWPLGGSVCCSLLIFMSPFNLLTWQKMALAPRRQVDLLRFESCVCSEVSGEQQSLDKRSGEGT